MAIWGGSFLQSAIPRYKVLRIIDRLAYKIKYPTQIDSQKLLHSQREYVYAFFCFLTVFHCFVNKYLLSPDKGVHVTGDCLFVSKITQYIVERY